MSRSREEIFARYDTLAQFLSKCYGEHVEITLHDISDLSHSAIAIYNGHISGRQVGAPMNYFGLNVIQEKLYKTQDYAVDYQCVRQNGRFVRSSTFFIKDDEGELIGTMCVNVDVSRFVQLSREFGHLAFGDQAGEQLPEPQLTPSDSAPSPFPTSVESMIEDTLLEYIAGGIDVEDLSMEQKVEVVKKLSNKGIFVLKGTVRKVSQALGVSEPTIYRYLNLANAEE